MERASPARSELQQPLRLLGLWDRGMAHLYGPEMAVLLHVLTGGESSAHSLCDLLGVKELCSYYSCVCLKNEVLLTMNKL